MKHRISTQKLILVLLVTSVVTILGMNLFSSPEKEVKRNIAHEYGIDRHIERLEGILAQAGVIA